MLGTLFDEPPIVERINTPRSWLWTPPERRSEDGLCGVCLAVHRSWRTFVKSAIQAAAIATFVALGAQYTVLDAQGNVVGTLVTDAPPAAQIRVIGITDAARGTTSAQPRRLDRTFHPDYSKALSVDQLTRAWHDEVDRINPPIVTGGG